MTSKTSKISYTISDSRWSGTVVEPYNFINVTETIQPVEPYFDKQESGFICTVCKISIEKDRTDLIAHYKSDWHRHNLHRVLQGRPLLTEDEFEQMISENNQLSSLDTESDDEIIPFTGGAHAYFISDGTVYSIYQCILLKNEIISRNLFQRPLDCAILLLSAGHFCGGIFKNHELVTHKSFHRYVIRAKQGTTQSVSDGRGTAAKSAGASVRRYNEKALKDEIQCLLASWSELLEQSPLIFAIVTCLSPALYISLTDKLVTQSFPSNPLLKAGPPISIHRENWLEIGDEFKIMTIPFETHRPTVDELQRTWSRLKIIRSHGLLADFNEEQKRLTKLRKKQRKLVRRKILGVKYPSSESSPESDNHDNIIDEIKQRQPELLINISNEEKTNLEQHETVVDLLSKANSQALYACIRLNSISKLRQLLENSKDKKEDFLKYIREMKFPPVSSTFLHIVARKGAVEILGELLLLGCDPAIKDDDGKVPYQVAQNRIVRQAFSKFRSQHPDAFNWNVSQIPELTIVNEEQLTKEAEKKRIQREKKKQRDKARKVARHQERIEQEQRQKYLELSDREKRALAAERRLAVSLQQCRPIVENDGNRCFKCGAVLPLKHFEYCDNHFCSLTCLQQHRQEHPPDLIS
ncbi:Protein vms-1 [Dirofilaria immitis]|nr:Protein vms-1 [Dirofilaria immitis]